MTGTGPAVVPTLQAVTDSSMPLEERMRVLQVCFVEVLQDQLKQDKQVTDLQVQLEASHKETEAGGYEPEVSVYACPHAGMGSQHEAFSSQA